MQSGLVRPLADIFRNATRSEDRRPLDDRRLGRLRRRSGRRCWSICCWTPTSRSSWRCFRSSEARRNGAKPLAAEIDKPLEPAWNDPLSNPAWKNPDASAIRQIEAAQGIVTERFAFCQTMPLPEFSRVVEALRSLGLSAHAVPPVSRRRHSGGRGLDAGRARLAHGARSVLRRDLRAGCRISERISVPRGCQAPSVSATRSSMPPCG